MFNKWRIKAPSYNNDFIDICMFMHIYVPSPAVDFGVVCVTYLQIFIYVLSALGFVLFFPAVYLCYKTRKLAAKQLGSNGIRMMTPRKPPPRQRAPMGHAQNRGHKQKLYGQGSHPTDSMA
ncbi:hypothetical protein PoB_003478100 [Plakobranchus ocellatus]|uniref:Uncharacterized protein n=1 Tax=Plakobranchus ocellatus TaxID=259542 RepID=A0AAV4AAT1_9GAST|nr:hypothetical protein PoB_003478100 [Plakobranchus ocellatus]